LAQRWDALVLAQCALRAPQERLLAAVAVCAADGDALEAAGAAALPAAAPPAGGPAAERALGAAAAGAEAAEEAAAQAAARAQGAFAAALLRPPGAARAARRHLRAVLQGARCAPPGALAALRPPGTLRQPCPGWVALLRRQSSWRPRCPKRFEQAWPREVAALQAARSTASAGCRAGTSWATARWRGAPAAASPRRPRSKERSGILMACAAS